MQQYRDEYQRKLTTPERAVECLKNGDTIVHGVTFAEPPALLAAIANRARASEQDRFTIFSFNPQKHAASTYLQLDLQDRIFARSWFLGAPARHLAAVGLVQFIPCSLHHVPKFLRENMQVDVCVTTVSPMDRAGFFSFGTANDLTSTAARLAKTLILEVNQNMPRVFGDSMVHISEVHAVVENHVPLLQFTPPEPREHDETIGRLIAEIIPDHAVIQLGIGVLPSAVCPYLANHKDLGIHSELFGPGMVDLIRKGVITGRAKNLHPRKHVFSVSFGTDDTFDFMNDNPSLLSFPSDYVMDPMVIAKNDNMVAINSIIQVDLTGQCNAESLAGRMYSGTGGQLDFVRGATAAKNGKAIMAFYSTAQNGTVSRVVPRLDSNAAVTTPRSDVQYLCTEHGVVNLKSMSLGERATAIISLAHPKFRDELMREAEEMQLF